MERSSFWLLLVIVITISQCLPVPFLAAQSSTLRQTGQISGRVLDADTGDPLAGVAVTLGPRPGAVYASSVKHTGADGTYTFDGLAPGKYAVGAYGKGFTRVVYGVDPYNGGWKPLTVGTGHANIQIDIRLKPEAAVTPMDAAALPRPVPSWGDWTVGPGLFAPGGRLIAIALGGPAMQVLLYDRVAHTFVMTPNPSQISDHVVSDSPGMAWLDDTLYVQAEDRTTSRTRFFRVTAAGSEPISAVPPEAAAALQHESLPGLGSAVESANVDGYVVKAENIGHGRFNLFTQTQLGERLRLIVSGSWELQNFIYEPDRSLILFLEDFADWIWGDPSEGRHSAI